MKRIFLASFIICLSLQFASAQESYNLKLKFEKGKTYSYKSETNADIVQELMGNEMAIKTSVYNSGKFEIADILENGNVEYISYMDSGSVFTSMPTGDTTITLTPYLNKRTKVTVTPKGDVVSTEIIDTIQTDNPLVSDREMIPLPTLPKHEIKIGDTWKETKPDTVGMLGGKMIRLDSLEYTVSGKENKLGYDCLVIDFKSNAVIEGNGSMQGINFVMEGTGISSGKNYFAIKEGFFVYSESTQEGEMTMAATGQQNMIIPISQKINVKLSLTGIK